MLEARAATYYKAALAAIEKLQAGVQIREPSPRYAVCMCELVSVSVSVSVKYREHLPATIGPYSPPYGSCRFTSGNFRPGMLCVFGFERRNERVAANYNKAVLATIGELLAVQSIAQV